MKRYLMIIGALSMLTFLGACSEGDLKIETAKQGISVEKNENAQNVPTQEELNEQLKLEAVEIDFVKANGDEIKQGTQVKVTGEITIISKTGTLGEFTLTTTDADGHGIYSINNWFGVDVKEGQTVTVYGMYEGKSELGFPTINATVIE